ncbi:hypothetical protein HanHA89_Chr14g0585861 [Helianthus annuus]|nr:hypothetical protein HanHA89_Chr14g0585861 [Helianthus annuus]
MRQGDPLSPFLILIVMEALSCMMKKACNLGSFDGFKMPNGGSSISHLLYADDAIFMGHVYMVLVWTNRKLTGWPLSWGVKRGKFLVFILGFRLGIT